MVYLIGYNHAIAEKKTVFYADMSPDRSAVWDWWIYPQILSNFDHLNFKWVKKPFMVIWGSNIIIV